MITRTGDRLELRYLNDVAQLIVRYAQRCEENQGLRALVDYPQQHAAISPAILTPAK